MTRNEAIEQENIESIYKMLHEFRNWNREWDLYMAEHPDNSDEFVVSLAKKFTVTPRKD